METQVMLERLPPQSYLLAMPYGSKSKIMIKLCGNCSERCILLEEFNQDSGVYLCMICMGVGYQCRNFRLCHNYYNYEDIRSGAILYPDKNDQLCTECQSDKCLFDATGTHFKKARLGLADQYNLCYTCFKDDCKCKASQVDIFLINYKICIRKTKNPYYWKYIVENKNTRTYSDYCNYCFETCVITDEKHTFSHKELIDISTLKRKYGDGFNYYKCDCDNCLE